MSKAVLAIAPKMAESGKTSVAVVDFTDFQMMVTELGRFLAEELQSALVNHGAQGFRVVDRTHLKAILQESKLESQHVVEIQ